MDAPLKQGTLDLALLGTLEDGALYGLEILKEINDRTHGAFELKEGSLYPALHRLVKAGWVHTHWQPSTNGGPPRKYYELSKNGHDALKHKKQEWKQLVGALERLLLQTQRWQQHGQVLRRNFR